MSDLSPVPGHIRTEGSRAGYFCSCEGQLAPDGQCPDGCDHADHYSNDGHPECEDRFDEIRTAYASLPDAEGYAEETAAWDGAQTEVTE